MREAFVHIGLPRTGTTSLQRVLSTLRPALLRRGILYPDLTPRSESAPHLSHQHLGEALDGRRGRRERDELLGRLSEQLRDPSVRVAILSYEALCLPRGGTAARRLGDVLTRVGMRMTPLLTVKPQSALLNSAYTWRTQFLREARDFATFRAAASAGRRLDFEAMADPWRAACDGRLLCVPTADARSDRPLLERVLEELALSAEVLPLLAPDDLRLRENASPGPVSVEASRRLRAEGARLDRQARDATRFLEALCRDRGWDRDPFNGLDAAARAQDEARFTARNDRFAAQVWGEPWARRVAAVPDRPVNELAGAASAEVEQALAEASRRFGIERLGRPEAAVRRLGSLAYAAAGQALRRVRLAG